MSASEAEFTGLHWDLQSEMEVMSGLLSDLATDEATGLLHEPFIEGIPEMIEKLVADIPDARIGFRLTFSASPFPGAQALLEWVREDMGGHWYHSDLTGAEGWLCPAIFEYFESVRTAERN